MTCLESLRERRDPFGGRGRTSAESRTKKEKPIDWTLGPQPHGFYAVEAVLAQDGKPILTKRTSFAVMDSLSEASDQGEFGWTIKRTDDMLALKELAEIASQAGINWLKYPLWGSVSDASSPTPAQISAFFEELSQRHITPVGFLNEPPHELRSQFARDWTGVSELFTMRTEFWRESIEKVIARYSSHVRHWQLGQEGDESFVGMSSQNLAQTVARVKSEFDRIGRDTRIGVHWNWETPPPRRSDVRGIFLSMSTRQRLKENELAQKLKGLKAADAPDRWVLLKPLSKSGFTPNERGSDLVKKMVEAKIGGAEKIFIDDVFDEDSGLLNSGGAPSPLFLPWRTTAMALGGAEFIGSFLLPEGSRNYAFARKGDVAIVVWNNEPVDEDLYLSEESIVTDVLGRRIRIPVMASGQRQKLRIGPSPLVIRHFPEPIARWMAAVSFEKGRLPSKTGKQREIIHGINTFHQGVNGQLRIIVPKDWKVEPPELRFSLAAGEKFDIPITLELPSNTSLGSQRIALDFALSPYSFRVYRDYEVGLGDVVFSVVDTRLDNGDLQIKQLIVNNTKPEERLNFECNLYIPGRKRMQRIVTKLANGRDTQVYILPDADSLRGQQLQLRAQQVGGQRISESPLEGRRELGNQGASCGRAVPADSVAAPGAAPVCWNLPRSSKLRKYELGSPAGSSSVTVREVLEFLRELAPLELAESWDNVGHLWGDADRPVTRVMTCLTLSLDVANEAVRCGAELVVSHHPILFRPIQRLTPDTLDGRILGLLARHEIAVYSAHTAYDNARDGINQQLAERLGLESVSALRPFSPATSIAAAGSPGAGRMGRLPTPCTLMPLIADIKHKLGLTQLQFVGSPELRVERLAIACGSAAEFLDDAIELGCQAVLTGEARFHSCVEARERGAALILVGHFASEQPAMQRLAEQIQRRFPTLKVAASTVESDPLHCT